MHPQWQDFLVRQGAVLTDGRVSNFGDPAHERQAVAQGTIIADLSHLGLLQVEGADAVTFLQGQVTNDVKLLNGTHSLCRLRQNQGRIERSGTGIMFLERNLSPEMTTYRQIVGKTQF